MKKSPKPVVSRSDLWDDQMVVISKGDLKKIQDLCRQHRILGKLKALKIKVRVAE